jgi:hypothetical protein
MVWAIQLASKVLQGAAAKDFSDRYLGKVKLISDLGSSYPIRENTKGF